MKLKYKVTITFQDECFHKLSPVEIARENSGRTSSWEHSDAVGSRQFPHGAGYLLYGCERHYATGEASAAGAGIWVLFSGLSGFGSTGVVDGEGLADSGREFSFGIVRFWEGAWAAFWTTAN